MKRWSDNDLDLADFVAEEAEEAPELKKTKRGYTFLTTDPKDLEVIDLYTDSTQTVRLDDGRLGFADGQGGVWKTAQLGIPGYDYLYGEVDASEECTNAHVALGTNGHPAGSVITYCDQLR